MGPVVLIPIFIALFAKCSDNTANTDESDATIDTSPADGPGKDIGPTYSDAPRPFDSYPDMDYDAGGEFPSQLDTYEDADEGPVEEGVTNDADGSDLFDTVSDASDISDGLDTPDAPPEPDLPEVAPLPEVCPSTVVAPACDVIDVVAGDSATCFVKKTGDVFCTGKMIDADSDPNVAPFFSSLVPQKISGFKDITHVSMRLHHLMALDKKGTIWGLGQNAWGQLCNGGKATQNTPTAAIFPANMIDVQAGSFHSCGLHNSGTLYCCGQNYSGQLGLQKPFSGEAVPAVVPTPTQVPLSQVMSFLTLGDLHSSTIQESGAAFIWGNNGAGQLGSGTTGNKVYSPLILDKGVHHLGLGEDFTLLVYKADCTAAAVGAGEMGQLGLGGKDPKTKLTAIPGLSKLTEVRAGGQHAAAVTETGELYQWGTVTTGIKINDPINPADDEPIQDTLLSPTKVPGLGPVVALSVGTHHTVAMDTSCTIFAWGQGDSGQLGNGKTESSTAPVKVSTF